MQLYQTNPDKMKWRVTPFPWLEGILNILGESMPTAGRYVFIGGEDVEDVNDADSESAALLSSSHISTPRLPSIDDVESEKQDVETRERKRTRDSGPVPSRKKKLSGLDAMEKMAEGITAMAEAMRLSYSSESQQPHKILQGTIDYTIQAQAQEKVQEESCLTEAGQLFMIERFTDLALARTYLSLKKASLRTMFLKKQVESEDGNYFINWSGG
jgi:hypothetical protein